MPIAIAHVNILCDTNLFQRFLLENSGSSGNVRVKEFDGPPVIPFDNNEVATAIGEGQQAVNELDCYVSSPEARNGPWYWNFFRWVSVSCDDTLLVDKIL